MEEVRIKTLREMKVWAKKFASDLSPNTLVLLEGDLGAGKTFLVSEVAASFGISQTASPTFSLHNIYQNEKVRIDHFDLYRLEDFSDLESSGFYDILEETDNIVFVEWADRLKESMLPLDKKILRLKISIEKDESRKLFLEKN